MATNETTPTGTKKAKAPKPEKPKKMKKVVVRDFISVKHTYTRDERDQITSKLTGAVQQAVELELQMKSVAKDYKAKIDTAKSIVNEATNQLTNGYEMQQVEASVELDRKKGVKRISHHAPGQKHHMRFIREEPMAQTDYQRLPLDLAPTKPKDDKKANKNAAATAAAKPAEKTADKPAEAKAGDAKPVLPEEEAEPAV